MLGGPLERSGFPPPSGGFTPSRCGLLLLRRSQIRRRLRKILWEQWKKPQTRCRKMVALGLEAARARKATATGRGAWWNAGASHMHAAVNNRLLAVWGLLNLLTQLRDLQRRT